MRRKLLSVVLCVCMMLTMAPFAFAKGSDDTSTTNTQEQAPVANSSSSGSGGSTTSVSLPKDNTGNLTISTNNAVLDGSVDGSSNLTYTNGIITVNADNVTIKNLVFGDNAKLVVNTTGKFTLTGCTFAPTQVYNKATDTPVRTAVTLNVGEAVVTENTFKGVASGYYNAIEFGIGASNNDLSKATITGNTFNSAIQNNYFNFYNMTEGATIDIESNHFLLANKGSNAIRISNFKNVSGVAFNVNKNEYTYENASDDSIYEGFILLQDYSEGDTVQNFSGITINITNLTSPSNATQLFYVYDNQDGIITTNQPIVKGDSSIAKFFSARIGDTYYASLANAVADASTTSTDTIKLLKDTTERLTLNNGKDITLDLDGHTLSYANQTVSVRHGKLTVNGPGTIKENSPYLGAILIKGSTNQGDTNYSVVNVNGDVTLSGWAPVFVDQNSEKAYGITVNLNGATLKAQKDTGGDNGVGLYVNGSIKDTVNAPVIKLENTTIDAQGEGMYLAGYADTTIKGGSIVGTQTGIEIRAGSLELNGGTYTATANTFTCGPNGSGSTTEGAAIAIAQHTTKKDITVTINNGTFVGVKALNESNPQNNDPAPQVNLSISNGNFNGEITTADVHNFITGGYFTTDPSAYCVENKTGVATGKADYPYTVGDKKADSQPATVDSATVPANTTSTDPIVKEAAEKISGATLGNSNSIEAATKNEANNNTITADTTVGSSSTVLDSLKTIPSNSNIQPTDVAIVYQTYVDVTVTDAKKDSSNLTELTVNLTPMYRVVATTKNVTDIKVKGDSGVIDNEANAILIENAKKLNVPAQAYEVTLALPSGFAINGAKLSIKHTKGSSVEYYTGTVSEASSSSEDLKPIFVTFTTNGFSPFVISAPVASIGDDVYPSLQAAIDAVQDGQTIKLTKACAENVTVSRAVKFTLNKDGEGFTGSIAAGSRYSMTTSETTSGNTEYTFTSVGGGSSSSISTPTTYAVNVNAATNGAVAADKKTASKGTTVTVTASPSKGYVVDAVKVVDKDGKDVAVTGKDGKYVFTMPGSAVTVTGTFKAETPAPVALPFTDVKSGNWFYDAVKYAYEQGLMTGTSATTFAPNGTMNRAMIVTVLYRLEKSPAVTGASKFTDVPAGQWYSDAVAWAAANKIVNGYDETTFGPMNAVTREQMAAILFRYEQVKGLENVTLEENLNRFPDQNKISAYAIPALQWAVGQKIINGNADGTLDPTGTATRAQVAQIFTNLLNQ